MVYDIDDMEEKLPHIIKSNHIHIKRVLDVHIGIVNEDGASDGGRENLKKQIKRLELEVSALSEENSTLIVEKSKLQTDMIQLRRRITELNTRNKTVEEENEMLCEENEFLREMADKTKEIKKSDFSKKRMVQYNETTRGMGD
jgi:predicted nuclease with TOPRIM domain